LQPRFHRCGNLDLKVGMVRRAVHRQHQHADIAVFLGAEGGNDGAGAMIATPASWRGAACRPSSADCQRRHV
jgi:hypothetical protein